jgi:hypothetical protein
MIKLASFRQNAVTYQAVKCYRENFNQEMECLSYNHAGNVRKEISEAKQVEFLVI